MGLLAPLATCDASDALARVGGRVTTAARAERWTKGQSQAQEGNAG